MILLTSCAERTDIPSAPVELKTDLNAERQTREGWGVSLCWWGNRIGLCGDADYNGNGIPDREELVEMAFSPEYLNFNIVRYNVGGGKGGGAKIDY